MKSFLLILSLGVCLAAWAANVPYVSPAFKAKAAGGGPNSWYDISTTANTSGGFQTVVGYETVTVAQGGTATKIRCKMTQVSGTWSVTAALYNSAGNSLLASGTNGPTSGSGYVEITFAAPVSVSATTYIIAFQCDNGGATFDYDNSTGTTSYGGQTYGVWAASLPFTASFTGNMNVGVFVQ